MLHAKTAVIDKVWSTIGSNNLDTQSILTNDEANAVIADGTYQCTEGIDRCRRYGSVLHATERLRNDSVACNAYFLASYRRVHYPPRLNSLLYCHNMEQGRFFAFPAQILITLMQA
jgi:phosphatidylserine/phosphatidylglycerophosphate/cardiolipin synthase-like enzyme